MIDRIAVCVDGSDQADAAFAAALELASRLKAGLLILTVAPSEVAQYMSGAQGPSDETVRRHSELAEKYLSLAHAKGIEDAGFDVLEGNPADAILEHLERDPVPLVVMGARGLSRTQRIILGSVSLAVSLHAPCSVMVVRPRPKGPPVKGARRHRR